MSCVSALVRRGLRQCFWNQPPPRVALAFRNSVGVGKSCYHKDRREANTIIRYHQSDRLETKPQLRKRAQHTGYSAFENSEIRARRRVSTFGEVDAASETLKTDIAAGNVEAVQYLEQAIASRSCPLQTIRMCLKGEYERLTKFRRTERADVMRLEGKKLARVVLDYIWTDERLWGPLVAIDGDTIVSLCYFAVYEGLESLLTGWLSADVATPFAPVPDKPHLWRGSFFRSILLAHSTRDVDNRLDEALQCFFRILDHRDQLITKAPPSTRPPIHGLGNRPAVEALTREISSGLCNNTDEYLYDRFVSFNHHTVTRKDQYELAGKVRLAILELYHPTRPEYKSALEIFRTRIQVASTSADVKIIRDKMAISDRALKLFISRASELASRSNQPADAALIGEQGLRLQAVSTKFPSDSRDVMRHKW